MTSAFGVDHEAISKVSEGKITGAILSGAVGADVGIRAGKRHLANKKGANVSVKDAIKHPIRSDYKYNAAFQRSRAGKLSAKAAATPDPKKAAKLEGRANRNRWAANVNNEAGKRGGIAYQTSGDYKGYKKDQKYKAPTTIGKSMNVSAFGVEHADADIEKAFGFSQVTTGLKRMTGAAKAGFKGAAGPQPTKAAGMARNAGAAVKTASTNTKSFLGTKPGKVAAGIGGGGVVGGGAYGLSQRKR